MGLKKDLHDSQNFIRKSKKISLIAPTNILPKVILKKKKIEKSVCLQDSMRKVKSPRLLHSPKISQIINSKNKK